MKIKFIFIVLAIILALGGAVASKVDDCENYPQYRKMGSTYVLAGQYGYNFACLDLGGVCTYYKPNPFVEVYLPCRTGAFQAIFP